MRFEIAIIHRDLSSLLDVVTVHLAIAFQAKASLSHFTSKLKEVPLPSPSSDAHMYALRKSRNNLAW
jgi:hypothetical protein